MLTDHQYDIERNDSDAGPFSHTYGFYILMGGLTVNVTHLHDRLDKVLISPSGLIHLARKGYFFHVSDADIKDRSKASGLAKGLVLLQITWTVLQCLSRKATGLPLSVLEVHTLVHAGCALIMYVLWFNKPMDVSEPVDVSSNIPDRIIALMLVQNHRFGMQPYGNLELPIEYRSVRLSGSTPSTTAGIWPTRRISEAAYLMFNPYPTGERQHSGTAQGSMPDATTTLDIMANTPDQLRLQKIDSQAILSQSGHANQDNDASAESVFIDPLVGTPPTTSSASDAPPIMGSQSTSRKQHARLKAQRAGALKLKYLITPRRGEAVYASTASTSGDPATLPEHICIGYESKPIAGVKVVTAVSTGQFLQNGIGPNAFVTGEWRGDDVRQRDPPFRVPTSILQVSDDIRKKLPLDRVDKSTIQYYCPLSIMLSQNDVRRWELAGAAFRDELASCGIQPPQDGSFMKIENEADTIEGAYFVASIHHANFLNFLYEDFFHIIWGAPRGTNRHTQTLRGIYRRLLEFDVFGLGPATVVMMLPGVLYGAFHLTLWFHEFPTYIEKLLWRISSVTLIGIPVIAVTLLFFRAAYRRVLQARAPSLPKTTIVNTDLEGSLPRELIYKPAGSIRRFFSWVKQDIRPGLWCLVIFALVLIVALYMFSRVYIIVESFISLRYVPVGVYTDVGWSKYIPHV